VQFPSDDFWIILNLHSAFSVIYGANARFWHWTFVTHNVDLITYFLHAVNVLSKHVDDKTLLVPQKTDIFLEEKYEHILFWSAQNKWK
jgi:hypothetical protein